MENDTLLVKQAVVDAEVAVRVPASGSATLQSGESRSWTTNGQPD